MKGFAALVIALVVAPVIAGLTVVACYDTTVKTPPCSVNAHQEGCPDWPHDSKRPNDGGTP